MVYFFKLFLYGSICIVFLLVWLLAEGLYTVVPSCFDLFLGGFSALDMDAREHNTERRGVSSLQWNPQCVDGAMQRTQRLHTMGVYTGEQLNPFFSSIKRSRSTRKNQKMQNIKTASNDKVFCLIFLILCCFSAFRV